MIKVNKKPSIKSVGVYVPVNFNDEIESFVKVLKIDKVKRKNGSTFDVTHTITRNGYYINWYKNVKPRKEDKIKFGCDKDIIPYKVDDCLRIVGQVKQRKANKWFTDDDGNYLRTTRLVYCRIVDNKGKKLDI